MLFDQNSVESQEGIAIRQINSELSEKAIILFDMVISFILNEEARQYKLTRIHIE